MDIISQIVSVINEWQSVFMAYEQDFYHFFPSLFLGNMILIFNISAFSALFKKLLLLPSP